MKNPSSPLIVLVAISALLAVDNAQGATPVISDPTATSIGIITGGDAGEGLDLDGNFPYALAIGADTTLSVKIRDATFLGLISNEVPGATLVAGNRLLNWYQVYYGDTQDDQNLVQATSSIRWSAAGDATTPQVILTLQNIDVGAQYKVQLMFGEQCCNRGFDVFVNGGLIVKDFNPGDTQGGIANGTQEALITHSYLATSTALEIRLDGRQASADYTDHNATFNAITVEKVGSASDTDGDGLPDAWEQLYFTNLTATASGNPDNDGLTNAEELAAGSNPTMADTDSDGLNDGVEVKTYNTNPTKADTDGDGLKDGEEVTTYKSNPLKADTDGDLLRDNLEVLTYHTDPSKADTDGDGFDDYYEIHFLTDPLDPNSKPRKTSVNLFTGPDPGQGLDLTGNFVYAISFGTTDRANYSTSDGTLTDIPPFGPVLDAIFTPDDVEGVTTVTSQVANNWNVDVNFGTSPAQQVLSSVMASIRWSDAGNATDDQDHRAVTVTFSKLQIGASYKLQLLFGERLWARGFDVSINGRPVAQAFAPYQWQGGFVGPGGATPRTNGVVLTHNFIASSTNVTFVLDGRSVTDPTMGDHNAIINGATLELVAAAVDSDADGLWDAWEMDNFGNLNQTASGDPDGDGLTNDKEFIANTDPNKADTDGDGLSDGQEVNTYKTDPLKTDTDGDGLTDGEEVNTYRTDPTKTDTDGDGFSDAEEVRAGDDPLTAEAATQLSNILIQPFTGGDPGEGLDLQGNFRYAFNVSSAGAAGKAGDADFTADDAPGIKVTAPANIPNWDTPAYGDSPADDVIEKVTQSIRYGPTVRVDLSGIVPGSTYKLQLLFYEQGSPGRGFNIYVDGVLLAQDFSPPQIQGGVNLTSAGAMVSAELLTHRHALVVVATVNGRTNPDLTDPNAILDGVTLEILNQVAPPTLGLTKEVDGKLTITTDSTLQVADTVTGVYTNLPTKSVTIDPNTAGSQKFYRGARP